MTGYLREPAISWLHDWLDDHPGARFVVTSQEIELCARELQDLEEDSDRYVSRELHSHDEEHRSAVVVEMLTEMKVWEATGWQYDDEEGLP